MKINHSMKHGFSIAKEQSECVVCGKVFSYYPSSKKGLYCSNCISERGLDWQMDMSKEENVNKVIESRGDRQHSHQDVSCDYCNKVFSCPNYRYDSNKNVFCSKECSENFKRDNWQGHNHPLYKGGEVSGYGSGWSKVREKARKRDDNTCQVCLNGEEDGERIEVHHIKPVREFEKKSDAHFLDNVVCLCKKCHSNAEHGNISRDSLKRKT